MTLPTIDQARSWRGMTLVATDDEPLGRIEAIYVDRSTRQPEWALVQTGMFGSARTFVPLADAAQRGDTVQVPHEPSVVREAPRLEQDAELSEQDEARLYAHYGILYTTAESASGLPAGETPASAPAAGAATAPVPSSRLEADVPAAEAVPGTGQMTTRPAAGTSWSAATIGADASAAGEPKGGRGGQAAATGGLSAAAGSTRAARTATRKAVQASQQAAASGRMAARKAGQEVAAVVAAIETTPESKRKARKRARARKRALAAAAGAARSVAAALAAAWRRVRKSE
jgi:PRC-barrel domain protein